jgi:hypothetical protein
MSEKNKSEVFSSPYELFLAHDSKNLQPNRSKEHGRRISTIWEKQINLEANHHRPAHNLPKSGRSLAWFRTSACHVDDPGSNPGDRTQPILLS